MALSWQLENLLYTQSDFGMSMPSRTTEGGTYRYGFNGKETDQETGIQDYGMRWYLPNIARFPSVDPITKEYPKLTPYQFAGNTPIQAIDLDGLEPLVATDYKTLEELKTKIKITYSTIIQGKEAREHREVQLSNTHNGVTVNDGLSEREYSQGELQQVPKITIPEQIFAAIKFPKAAYYRNELQSIKSMSYREKNDGKRGMAFDDIAIELTKRTLNKGKGTLQNTYLHVSSQALITILFGESVADFAGHLHERGQDALLTGKFSSQKALDSGIDNYCDLINNQWGQELGKTIVKKFNISKNTVWDNDLSAKVLNEMQTFYNKQMGKSFSSKFKPSEKFIQNFTNFINNKQ